MQVAQDGGEGIRGHVIKISYWSPEGTGARLLSAKPGRRADAARVRIFILIRPFCRSWIGVLSGGAAVGAMAERGVALVPCGL
jgi:hypothetical protein